MTEKNITTNNYMKAVEQSELNIIKKKAIIEKINKLENPISQLTKAIKPNQLLNILR